MVGVLVYLFDVPKAVRLTWRHQETHGLITTVNMANHGETSVQYSVGQRRFGRKFRAVGVDAGGTVLVRYDPDQPEIALVEEPGRALVSGFFYSIVGATFLCKMLRLIFPVNRTRAT